MVTCKLIRRPARRSSVAATTALMRGVSHQGWSLPDLKRVAQCVEEIDASGDDEREQ